MLVSSILQSFHLLTVTKLSTTDNGHFETVNGHSRSVFSEFFRTEMYMLD